MCFRLVMHVMAVTMNSPTSTMGAERTVKSASDFLEPNIVIAVPRLVTSPDFNLIENASAIMEQHLRKMKKYPTTADGLYLHLSEIWFDSLSAFFSTLVKLMVSRCNAVKT